MKKLIAILFISAFFFSFKKNENKKIIGHWVSGIDLYDIKVNDTLTFTKTKSKDINYQWAGILAGIQFDPNADFSEYHNVMCSSETSPVRFSDEKWTLVNDTLKINSAEREMEWRIVGLKNKKLTIVVLKMNSK